LPKVGTLIALPAADGIPPTLRPLMNEGQRLWNRVWGEGAVWLSPNTDIELVQMLAETMDERLGLRAYVLSGEGEWRDRIALRRRQSRPHRLPQTAAPGRQIPST
jgi:hypothetical protein